MYTPSELVAVETQEVPSDVLTNDRKTYYETEAYERLFSWYKFFWWIYYIVVIMLILAFVFSPSDLTVIKKVIITLLFIFYPYYIFYIVGWFYERYVWIQSKIPKNVYNNL